MYVSLKDVAALAGVSFQTAGKVLNGGTATVSATTRARILEAGRRLGYVPNAVARGLVMRTSYAIGIIADDLADWVLSQFVVGAERRLRRAGHAVLIGATGAAAGDSGTYVRQLLERRVDGILAAAPHLENDVGAGAALHSTIPTVSIHHVAGGRIPLVGSDHAETGRLAAEHLLALGHRRIGMVTGPSGRRVVVRRARGFRAVLRDAGFSLGPGRVIQAKWSASSGYLATQRLLRAQPKLTAVFAHSDLIAIGALAAIQESGRKVPDDCAIVGCDDLPFSAYLSPPLSSVRIPFRETGEIAASILLDLIAGKEVAGRTLLPVTLVVRRSTDPSWPRPAAQIEGSLA